MEISSRFLAASYRKTEWLVKKWQHFCPLASHISALTNTQFFMVKYGRLRDIVNSTTQKKQKNYWSSFPFLRQQKLYRLRGCWVKRKAFGIPGQSSSPLMCWPFLITTQPQKYRIVMPQMLHKKHISQSWSKRAIVQQLLHCPSD